MTDRGAGDGENPELGHLAAQAAKWSVFTQVFSKLISPLTTMVLARILTPDAFGIVALSTMIVSFAQMLSEAGFQRYLIQKQFGSPAVLGRYASVAFWTNFGVSIMVLGVVAAVSDPLASMLGAEGLGSVLIVGCLSLPLTALVSVHTALFQKSFNFRALFSARVGSSLFMALVAIPLAIHGLGFWSIVVGTNCSLAVQAIWLSAVSRWRPRFEFDWAALREMTRYSIWIFLESAATWLNTWAGTFFIARLLPSRFVGYYNTSLTVSTSIVGIVTAAVLPVAFATLSVVQGEKAVFERYFLKVQKYLALLCFPIGAGCFVYRDLVTLVVLGPQWSGAAPFLGNWMLVSGVVVVFGYVSSEAYRAVGHPEYSLIVQVLYLIPILPALYFGAVRGFETLAVVVPISRLSVVVINLVVMRATLGLSPLRMFGNVRSILAQTLVCLTPGFFVTLVTDSAGIHFACVLLSVLLYLVLLISWRDTRRCLLDLLDRVGAPQRVTGWLHRLRDTP